MGQYSHRRVSELKAFIKKYNNHFEIKVTGKTKPQLIEAIESGMKKEVTEELKQAHSDLLMKDKKTKKMEVKEEPKEEPKKPVIKKIAIKAKPKTKIGLRPVEKRVEIGELNKGKLYKSNLREILEKKKEEEKDPKLKLNLTESKRKISRRRAFLSQSQTRPKL